MAREEKQTVLIRVTDIRQPGQITYINPRAIEAVGYDDGIASVLISGKVFKLEMGRDEMYEKFGRYIDWED